MVDVIELLSENGFIKYNKKIGKLLGFDASVLLGELCSKYKYFEIREELKDGMFYLTRNTIEEDIGMSSDYQRTALKKLTKAGVVEVKKIGMPSKNYYKINEQVLCELLSKSTESKENQQLSVSPTTSDGSDRQQVVAKTDTNKIIYNNIYKGCESEDSHESVSEERLNYNHLRSQIMQCCEELSVDSSDSELIYKIIFKYLVSYELNTGKSHKTLSDDTIKNIINSIIYPPDIIDDWRNMNCWSFMVEKHFNTVYKNCDYSICHFLTNGVLEHRFYEIRHLL